jgi:hypothetical protein
MQNHLSTKADIFSARALHRLVYAIESSENRSGILVAGPLFSALWPKSAAADTLRAEGGGDWRPTVNKLKLGAVLAESD